MILMAIVALGITFGMPKLMENSMCLAAALRKREYGLVCRIVELTFVVDPELRAEFEQHSRSSPITGATNSAMTGGGFDLAGWMAGTSPSPMANGEAPRGGATGSVRRRG